MTAGRYFQALCVASALTCGLLIGIELRRIFKRRYQRWSGPPNALIGCWQLVRSDEKPFEPAEAEFLEDGRLNYSVLSEDRWQIMKLRYRIEGDVIVTNQPSAPREERSRFTLESDGTLTLELGGEQSRFRRGPKVAPNV